MQEKSTSLKLAQQRGTLKQIPIPRCEPECKTKQECIATHMLITHTPLVTSPFFILSYSYLRSYLPCCLSVN